MIAHVHVRAISLLFAWGTVVSAQTARVPENSPRDIPSEILATVSPLLVPKLFQDDWLLKEYIRGEEFAGVRSRLGDRFAVDAIFSRARVLAWDNTFEALLISCVATMDHDRFGIRAPIPGVVLWFPLTSEDEESFRDRWESLPSRLYPDTPRGRQGDRDKLQHFFGSALLAFVSEAREPAEAVGGFIEEKEEVLVVGGRADRRDVRANRQGQEFGLRLLHDREVRPSSFLTFLVAAAPRDSAAAPGLSTPADSSDDPREHR